MSRRVALPVIAAVLLAGGSACYQDDSSNGPASRKPLAKVLLTDAPFPYDSVTSVNLYVVRIEASTQMDATGGDWIVIAEPRRTFDLLQLQQGTTAILGEGEIPAGQYHAIRMTIDTSLSSIQGFGGEVPVNWNNYSASNEMPLYASVDYPVNVSSEGAEIVIDFDLGRSFLWDLYGTQMFTLFPWLRAISTAATGTIAGTVTTDDNGPVEPVPNASVTVCSPRLMTTDRWSRSRTQASRCAPLVLAIHRARPTLSPAVAATTQDATRWRSYARALTSCGSSGPIIRGSTP